MRHSALLVAAILGGMGVVAASNDLSVAGSRGAPDDYPRPSEAWLPGQHADYAPSGVPDFSQCRPEWSRPGSPGQWTHAGPVALADALWWLDSAHEPDPQPPSLAHDGHALVTAYPRFGPTLDDHHVENIAPLVEDLAARSGTNGTRDGDEARGTQWESLVTAARDYVSDRGLAPAYDLDSRLEPDGEWLAAVANRGGTTVLLLGVWEHQEGTWKRVGGHYAAMAGAAAGSGGLELGSGAGGPRGAAPSGTTGGAWLALADPLADTAAFGGYGRAEPADASSHGCRDAPRGHDDAAAVSHDRYELYSVPGLPGGRRALLGYFTPETAGDAAAFQGQNWALALAEHEAQWRRGTVAMAVDAGLAIAPRGPATSPTASGAGEPTSTANAGVTSTPSSGATSTSAAGATMTSSAGPTSTASAGATSTGLAHPSATATAGPTGSDTAAPTPSHWATTSPTSTADARGTDARPVPANPRAYLPWARR